MLKTQAKSMAFRFKPEHVQEVMVLVNDENSLADKIDPIWFGHLRPKVRIVTRRDLGYWPAAGISGWKSQQVMKLLGVAASSADWCMVLDAKTWFIKNYDFGVPQHSTSDSHSLTLATRKARHLLSY